MDRKAFGFSSKQVSRKGNQLNCREVYQLLSYQLTAVMREMEQFLVHSSKKPRLLQHPCKQAGSLAVFPYDNSAGRAAL